MKIQPLLASPVDLAKLRYPVICSAKLDGIRCLTTTEGPMSRKMKPIPNEHIFYMLKAINAVGLDGELMVKGDFNKVQSAVMRKSGRPDFYFNVFDCFQDAKGNDISEMAFEDRLEITQMRCNKIGGCVRFVPHIYIRSESDLMQYTDKTIAQGFEGTMIRSPEGHYKFGRSTAKEGILLKLKRFLDAEGTLVEIIEKMTNNNPAETDELGNTKRSSAKENLSPAGTSGSIVVQWRGKEFRVGFGPGLDDSVKQDWWNRRKEIKGQYIKFRYQELSKDGIPRFGKALGIRSPEDM
jgi:DNA ligase-1